MKKDRRLFIVSAGMAAGATVLGTSSGSAPLPSPGSPEGDVAGLISRYGTFAGLREYPNGEVHFKATRIDHARMAEALSRQENLPFERIKATPQNSVEILHRGRQYFIHHAV